MTLSCISVCSTVGGTLTLPTRRGRCWRGRTRRAHQCAAAGSLLCEAGRSGQCVTFFAAADENRFTNLVWLVVDTVRLAFLCQSVRANIRTGGSILLRLLREFHSLQGRHGEDPASGKPQRRKREPHISCTVVCPSRSFNGPKPWKSRCMDQGARLRGCTIPRRHSSPYGEIDTATFDDRHNTHGSLPMVSENNTSRKKVVSNAADLATEEFMSGATCSFSRRGCPAPSACGLQCRESTRTGFQRAITCVCISLRFISPKKQLVCAFLNLERLALLSSPCLWLLVSACVFCVNLFILCSSGRLLLRR